MQTKNAKYLWKRLASICVTGLLLAIGGLILFRDNTPVRDPIKIYRTQPIPSQTTTPSLPTRHAANTQHTPDEEQRVGEFSTAMPPETIPEDITSAEITTETLHLVPSPIDTQKTADTEQTDEVPSLEELHYTLHEYMLIVAQEINEKYPDIIELSSLTPEEIKKKYPTEAALYALGERVSQFEADYKGKIRYIIKGLIISGHSDELVNSFSQMEKTFRDNWGDEAADKIMEEFERKIGLRSND